MTAICPICHNSVAAYNIGVATIQIANHTYGGGLCAGSGTTRHTA